MRNAARASATGNGSECSLAHRIRVPSAFCVDYRVEPQASGFVIGLGLFAIGLFKKTCLADPSAELVAPVFSAASGTTIEFGEAWIAAFAYSFQIYFDFSGYSDMAIGIARLFGIVSPINSFSPYKAINIIDFRRRWNITLSRLLRDFLYTPLGGVAIVCRAVIST
jgi:alginate O-acetyltransferase complex protein AlgI